MASRRMKVPRPSAISSAEYFEMESSSRAQTAAAGTSRPRLRMPGGPRMSRRDIQLTQFAKNPGELAKYDHRFFLNLKLSHDLTRHFGISGASDKLFIELGPGPGMLTRALLTRQCRGVLGIEIDTKYNTHLDQIRNETKGRFQWANANVLDIDEVALMKTMYPGFAAELAAAATSHSSLHDERLADREARREARDAANRNFMDADDDGDNASWSRAGPSLALGGATNRLSRHSSLWLSDPKLEVVANLPYDRAASVAARYAVDCSRRENLYQFGRVPLHVFFQKGVAERVIAVPGTPEFTKLAVITQTYFRTAIRGTFTEKATYPKPDVYGALVSLEPRREPLVDVDGGVLFNFVQLVMKASSRRTTIMQSLRRCVPLEVADYMLREVRVDGDALPWHLPVKHIAELARLWATFLEATQQNAAKDRETVDWETNRSSNAETGRQQSSRVVGDAFDEEGNAEVHGEDFTVHTAATEEFGRRPRPSQRTRHNANDGPMRHAAPDWSSLPTLHDVHASAKAGDNFRPPQLKDDDSDRNRY